MAIVLTGGFDSIKQYTELQVDRLVANVQFKKESITKYPCNGRPTLTASNNPNGLGIYATIPMDTREASGAGDGSAVPNLRYVGRQKEQ